MSLFYRFRHRRLGIKLGFDIPCNVFGKGLKINHFGCIVVNPNARIGDWCDIHQGVNIGENVDKSAPVIGENVWIGPGAKLFGNITIGNNVMVGSGAKVLGPFKVGDNVKIAANAVVLEEIPPNCTAVGVPARIIQRGAVKPTQDLDQIHIPDPVAQEMNRLREKIDSLQCELCECEKRNANNK